MKFSRILTSFSYKHKLELPWALYPGIKISVGQREPRGLGGYYEIIVSCHFTLAFNNISVSETAKHEIRILELVKVTRLTGAGGIPHQGLKLGYIISSGIRAIVLSFNRNTLT